MGAQIEKIVVKIEEVRERPVWALDARIKFSGVQIENVRVRWVWASSVGVGGADESNRGEDRECAHVGTLGIKSWHLAWALGGASGVSIRLVYRGADRGGEWGHWVYEVGIYCGHCDCH